MIRFLINLVVYFASALVGIVAADLLLSDFSVTGWISYVWVAVIFALIQAILSPLINSMVRKNASAFAGGVGLISTFVALLITNIATSSLTITGASTWVFATLIVWLFTAIAAFILPFLVVKRVVNERRD